MHVLVSIANKSLPRIYRNTISALCKLMPPTRQEMSQDSINVLDISQS